MDKSLRILGDEAADLDGVDLAILAILQENCKLSLARIGRKVGLTAPSVIERIKKLEEGGVIQGYRAILNARLVGTDITGFIGVSVSHAKMIEAIADAVQEQDDVLECHHVTGEYTFLLKIKTANTRSLEELIRRIRSLNGVIRTETMIALSTRTERTQLSLNNGLRDEGTQSRREGRNGRKSQGAGHPRSHGS